VPTFKIVLAYDGTDFVGWQRQASGTSIQGLLEEALRALDERDVAVHGAGRTDAGVHALAQVASFTLARAIRADIVLRALNARLPPSVRILDAVDVDPLFHARFAARAKTYHYRIWNGDVVNPFERGYVWHLAGAVNVDAMRTAALALIGRHDFAAFQAAGSATRTTVREITLCAIGTAAGAAGGDGRLVPATAGSAMAPPCRGTSITVDVTGSGFLRHMVRTIAGSLVEVGRGRHEAGWLSQVLASRDRRRAGPTAPACGLFLVRVDYQPPAALADEP
jgi:tRNA pseudouridine38-40 synthase